MPGSIVTSSGEDTVTSAAYSGPGVPLLHPANEAATIQAHTLIGFIAFTSALHASIVRATRLQRSLSAHVRCGPYAHSNRSARRHSPVPLGARRYAPASALAHRRRRAVGSHQVARPDPGRQPDRDSDRRDAARET